MKTTKLATATSVAALCMSCIGAQAGVINVNASMTNAVNGDANAKAGVLAAMGINDPANWKLTSFKVSKMRNTGVKMTLPKAEYVFVASKEVVNCDATLTTQTISLSKDLTNSTSVTKSTTLDASVSATVGVNGGVVSGSATATAGMSMTDSNTASQSESVTVAQSTSITFQDVGGRLSVLQALKLQSDQIPWTATFTPADDDSIQITAQRTSGSGEVCLWAAANFTGHKKCYGIGRKGDIVEMKGRTLSLTVPAELTLRAWKGTGMSGESNDFTGDTVLDYRWTNQIGSIEVLGATRSASVAFSSIKGSIPEGKRTFTASGTQQISRTAPDSTKIVNYPMTQQDWQDTCAAAPAGHEMAMNAAAPPKPYGALKGGAPGTSAPAKAASAAPTPKGIKVRELNETELKARLKGAKPISG